MQRTKSYDYLLITRGLSALAVIFCHYPFDISALIGVKWLDWLFNPFGYIPVLIFFTLSGHLITLGFLKKRYLANTYTGIKAYYFSRALRILPLYYVSIIISALIYWQATIDSPARVLSLFIFLENYKPVNGIIFNHVYWTMPVEMLYFLLAPAIFIILKKCIESFGLVKTIFFIAVFFIGLSYFLLRSYEHTMHGIELTRREWSLATRFDFLYNLQAFTIGSLSAFAVQRKTIFPPPNFHFILLIISTVFIIWILFYTTTYTIPALNNSGLASLLLLYGLIPCIGLWLTAIAYLNKFTSNKNNSLLRMFEHLGNTSYAMYLFHMPILTVAERLVTPYRSIISNEMLSVIALTLTGFFSVCAYKFIEKPIMNLRNKHQHSSQKQLIHQAYEN